MSLPDACWPTEGNTSGKFNVRRVAEFGARNMLEYNPSGGHEPRPGKGEPALRHLNGRRFP
jgi:hypothetical protein